MGRCASTTSVTREVVMGCPIAIINITTQRETQMRKIERQMNQAIRSGKNFSSSNTTKSRLNALLDEFSYGMRVFQKNYEWFVSYKNVKEDFVSGMELAID